MLEEIVRQNRAHVLAYPEQMLSSDQVRIMSQFVARRCNQEPLQYIIGSTEFYHHCFEVTPDVLIPRPETEQVVEHVLNLLSQMMAPAPNLLDIGTGSGCIAITCKLEYPQSNVFACDISEPALRVARQNAERLEARVHFKQANILDTFDHSPWNVQFDLIVSNPPYIPDWEIKTLEPVVRDFEPGLALSAGTDPLRFYRAILSSVHVLLKPKGRLVFETHADYGESVAALMRNAGSVETEVHPDWAGLPRIVSGQFS
jgi:release factor glutamine methyltransferase